MQETAINQNITLKLIPMTKLKTTTIGIYIHRPLTKKEASLNALLPSVLKRGCRLCPDTEAIAAYLEDLYGATLASTVIKRGDDHIMHFDLETISDKYALGGEKLCASLTRLMLSILFEPNVRDGEFDAQIVEQEKNNAKDKISALKNDKRSYASSRCMEEMCEGESFAISRLGTAEGIDEITPRSLYLHYKNIITSSPIDIYVCGEADAEALAAAVREYISGLEFSTPTLPQTQILKKSDAEKKDVTERMDVTQGKLAIGFRTNTAPTDADYSALLVLNSLYGGGAHSKLFNNVREKLSLAYYASSQLEKFKGLLVVNAGIEFKNEKLAYDESLAQLEEIRRANISEQEFSSSINDILNSLNSYYDDPRYLQNFYLSQHIAGTNRDIEYVKEQIKNVTVDDVVEVSKKLELDTVYFLAGKEEN
ncbi:MAG: pitrilysin family protein [Clostridiales bacterium]|nr:pitrilysin family protein [Clostridiales bacterium]